MKAIVSIGLAFLASAPAAHADPVSDRAAAQRLYGAQSWQAAAAAFAPLAAADPDDNQSAYFLAVSLARSDHCADARPALDRAIALGALGGRPSLRRAHVEAAACAAATGDKQAALAHLETAYARFGFDDFHSLNADPRFASLQSDARFLALSAQAPHASNRVSGWRADLDIFAALIVRRHPNPFHAVSEVAWHQAVEALRSDIPSLSDVQISGRFMQLAALIGDGHTTIIPPLEGAGAFHLLPIWPYALGDNWYVLAADRQHADLVGARILALGGQPIAQVMARLQSMLPHDNAMTAKWTGSIALQFSELAVLAAGAADPLNVIVDVVDARGVRRSVTLTGGPIDRNPTSRWSPQGWPSMADRAPLPAWLAHASEPFWIGQPDPHGLLYVQVNQIADGDSETFEHFVSVLGQRLRQTNVRALVLDLRHNNGGNGSLNWGLVREIVRAENIDREGALYVITGRRTFSAAMNLASMLETHTHAIFVGEATGSRPNFYGEDTSFTLPNSGLTGSISSAWFQGGETSDDLRPWIAPSLPAPLTVADLIAGRDPAMAAIEAHLNSTAERRAQ